MGAETWALSAFFLESTCSGSDQLYLQIIEACNFNVVVQLTLIHLHVDSYGVSWGMRITQVYDAF